MVVSKENWKVVKLVEMLDSLKVWSLVDGMDVRLALWSVEMMALLMENTKVDALVNNLEQR
jgi:hypothetical protein